MLKRFLYYYKPHIRMLTLDMLASLLISVIGMVYPIVTNRMLNECGMGPLYVANPYECFVLMCLLSVSPLETFSEVWEKSYEENEGEG